MKMFSGLMPSSSRLAPRRLDLLALAEIGGEGDDLRAIFGLQPFQDDRGVEPARISEDDLLRLSVSVPSSREGPPELVVMRTVFAFADGPSSASGSGSKRMSRGGRCRRAPRRTRCRRPRRCRRFRASGMIDRRGDEMGRAGRGLEDDHLAGGLDRDHPFAAISARAGRRSNRRRRSARAGRRRGCRRASP